MTLIERWDLAHRFKAIAKCLEAMAMDKESSID